MKIFAPILFCLLSVNSICIASPEWNSGVVVLHSGEVLPGQIALHQSHDMVLLQSGDKRTVLPAHKIKCVLFYDAIKNINRRFITITTKDNTRISHRIFEVVLSGDITVLRRSASLFANINDEVSGFEYFLKVGNELITIRKFRTKIYPTIVDASAELEQFVRKNRLRPAFPADIIQIVGRHNEEVEAQALSVQKF